MQLRTPAYYKDFTCIAGKCIDNCCFGGWQIDIDDETIAKYSKVTGAFGDKLHSYVDADNGCFKLKNGQCPFLMSDNLCEIYKELGPENMGVVCTQFPRFTEYYGDIRETGIGLACEEAARIILQTDCDFSLVSSYISEEPVWGEYDKKLGSPLFNLRDRLMSVIDDKTYPMSPQEILIVILTVFNTLQAMINENDYDSIARYCDTFNKDATKEILFLSRLSETDKNKLKELRKTIWYSYLDLEPLNDYWKDLSNHAYEYLYESDEYYPDTFNDSFLSSKYTRIIKYYLFRYMLKAAFDHDLLGKAQLITANIMIINDLTAYQKCMVKDRTDDDIFMDVIHIFSRQIEYSEDNILELYDSFIFDEVFNYKSLTKILAGI